MPRNTSPASLNALRAFAAAGRHLNLTAAAAELFVTPSALSHQIRTLEKALGMNLFVRSRHGLELTEAGKTILPGITDGFDQITRTLELLSGREREHVLTVSMLSTFAMRWFIPRLARFQQRHADIEVRISTSITLVDFDRDDIDCAIRSGVGDWPGVIAEHLFTEHFTPVYSPSLDQTDLPLKRPEDLRSHTLLHARLRPDDWRIWLNAAGLEGMKPAHEQVFETRNFAIQAAVDGLGVAIVDPSLVSKEVEAGKLIQPFSQTLPSENAYYLVYPHRLADAPRMRAFRTWMLEEAAGA